MINAAAELADRDHPAHTVARKHKARLRTYILELAKAAKAPSPKTLADRLFLLVEGAIVTALIEGNSDSARQARQTATVLLTR